MITESITRSVTFLCTGGQVVVQDALRPMSKRECGQRPITGQATGRPTMSWKKDNPNPKISLANYLADTSEQSGSGEASARPIIGVIRVRVSTVREATSCPTLR